MGIKASKPQSAGKSSGSLSERGRGWGWGKGAGLTRGADTGAPRHKGSVRGGPRPPCPRTAVPSGGWSGGDSAPPRQAWWCTPGKAALAKGGGSRSEGGREKGETLHFLIWPPGWIDGRGSFART